MTQFYVSLTERCIAQFPFRSAAHVRPPPTIRDLTLTHI